MAGFQGPTFTFLSGTGAGPWNGRGLTSLALCLCLGLTLACGPLRKADAAYDAGRYDEALDEYNRALEKNPNHLEAKIGYRRAAPLAAGQHLLKAEAAKKRGDTELETKEVGIAAVLDPSNAMAQDWLMRLEAAAERERAREEAEESLEAARAKGQDVNGLPINPRSLDGMDLNFTRKTSLREILQQLSRNSGVNILMHASATAQEVTLTVDLRGLTFQKVLDALMLQCDMFYKVMDPNTIMVFKKTPQNLLEHENKLIQTFYLSNAEVENVRQIFSALMPQVRAFPDKRLNALTVLAKANDLTIAKRIVKQLDRAKAEVMIYLELLEVSERTATKLGLLPVDSIGTNVGSYVLGATANATGLGSQSGSLKIPRSSINYLFPGIRLDMAKTAGQTRLLANPNVRVVSGETGTVNIGDKITTTQSSIGPATTGSGTSGTTAATIGGALASQTSYSYEDVGVNITVKPRVHFNKDITIDLDAKVTTQLPGGDPGRPNISQRVMKTTARLRNGETAIFGGLLKEDERKSLQGLWGLSSIPVVKELLGHRIVDGSNTDVILSIRAQVVRTADLTEEDFEPFDPDQAPNVSKPFAPVPAKPRAKAAPSNPAPAADPVPAPPPPPVPPEAFAADDQDAPAGDDADPE